MGKKETKMQKKILYGQREKQKKNEKIRWRATSLMIGQADKWLCLNVNSLLGLELAWNKAWSVPPHCSSSWKLYNFMSKYCSFGFLHEFLVKTGLVIVPFAQIHIVVVIRIDSHTCSRGAVLRLQITWITIILLGRPVVMFNMLFMFVPLTRASMQYSIPHDAVFSLAGCVTSGLRSNGAGLRLARVWQAWQMQAFSVMAGLSACTSNTTGRHGELQARKPSADIILFTTRPKRVAARRKWGKIRELYNSFVILL